MTTTKKSATKPERGTETKGAKKRAPKVNTSGAADPNVAKSKSDTAGKGKTAEVSGGGTAPQFESLVSKFIELADVGIKLGINVVSLLTTFAKNQAGSMASMPQQATPDGQTQPTPAPEPNPGPARNYCIVNRTPIRPGDSVKVSFSINNDMRDAAKNLVLSCGGFAGATQGFAIPDHVFSIEPASATIAPLDFERFVLKGTIVPEAPADSYNGWIMVTGDEQLRIPAVLMVT